MIGKTINGYAIKRLIGSGGMADLYYAENTLRKPAAIKVLKKKWSDEPGIRDRFVMEARIMVTLDHPHIRKVFDMGEIDQQPAIIMEYLEGNTLKEALDSKEKPTEAQLRRYFDQCCEALAYTHSKGIIHRDIKPSNLFITNQDEIKILDFGIAKTRENVSNTLTGQTLGTILYMSPEQVKDPKRVDEKTDVYSLGVSFYHAVTGKAPYDANTDSSFDIQLKIVNEPLDCTILPLYWQQKLLPFLEKDKGRRPDLANYRKTGANDPDKMTVIDRLALVLPHETSWFEKHKPRIILGIILLAFSTVLGIWYFTKEKTNDEMAVETIDSASDGIDTALLAQPDIESAVTEHTKTHTTGSQKTKGKKIEEETIEVAEEVEEAFEEATYYSPTESRIQKVLAEIKNNMVRIPGGSFTMGCTAEQGIDCEVDEKPAHTRTVSSFYISKYELTQEQYSAIMGTNPSNFRGCDRCPVESVSWNDAQAFISKLNRLAGTNYRLPSEAEWEYAARGGNDGTKYAGSFSPGNVAWYMYNSGSKTHPVGGKWPNGYGLHDMSGNVWEWCNDLYKAFPGNNEMQDRTGTIRVIRGGSWYNFPWLCRVTIRNYLDPDLRSQNFGFRLAASQL